MRVYIESFAIFRPRPIRRGRKIKDRMRCEIYIIFISNFHKLATECFQSTKKTENMGAFHPSRKNRKYKIERKNSIVSENNYYIKGVKKYGFEIY